MSILSLTDIIPEQLPADLIVDQQHTPENSKKAGSPPLLCVALWFGLKRSIRLLALWLGYALPFWALLARLALVQPSRLLAR